jgi:hypothetical protein
MSHEKWALQPGDKMLYGLRVCLIPPDKADNLPDHNAAEIAVFKGEREWVFLHLIPGNFLEHGLQNLLHGDSVHDRADAEVKIIR